MATKVITMTEFVDDIDGSEAEGTVTFAYGGAQYEIDLSAKNRKAMDAAFKPYIDKARKTGGRRARTSKTAAPAQKLDLSAVRVWAKENGHHVSNRGRVPAAVVAAYQAAH